MFLYHLKYIYLRTFVTHFSAVSYGIYSIEAFVNLIFYGVKQLEGYGIFLTLLIATNSQHLLLVIIFVSIIHNRFVNFSRDCFSSNNVHIKFVALLAAESQMRVLGKNFILYVTYEFACCVIVCLCSM